MSNLDEFEAIGRQKTRQHDREPCKLADALDQLAEADRANVTAALDRLEIKPGWISEWFAKRNLRVFTTTIANHRAKRCRCHA